MRITIDTREDSYEDALGVLRRAYGRHVLVRKKQETSGSSERVEATDRGAANKSPRRSATGRSGKEPAKRSRNGGRKSVSENASVTRGAVAESTALSTANKGAGKKAVAPSAAPAKGRRPGAPRQKPAANTAPPGRSEAIRSWARAQGMQVSARGRMPAKVIAAFLDAHKE